MKDILNYLCNMNQQDTEDKMLHKLAIICPRFEKISQLEAKTEETNAAWHDVNALCWAIGSISGAMQED